jgi:hypothetical protein
VWVPCTCPHGEAHELPPRAKKIVGEESRDYKTLLWAIPERTTDTQGRRMLEAMYRTLWYGE